MSIAIYNNQFLDIPLAHAIYKIMLDQELDIDDLAQFQPEMAKSLQYILDYEDHEKCALEDLVPTYFTIDV